MSSIIQVKGLKKNFGALQVLKGVDAAIEENEVVCIIGPSGSGKSTFLRCLNRLEEITEGEILIDGVHLSKENENEVRTEMGMVFQSFNLFPHMSVLDNVTIGPRKVRGIDRKEAEKKALELLARVGLRDKADGYPSSLSGGQKQRVAIARALAANPKVLLCDEATSALDPMTTDSILELLKRINQQMGITIVVITHEMEVIRKICHRVAIIDGGVIAEQGEVTEIFTAPKTAAAKKLFHVLPEGESGKGGAVLRLVFDGKQLYQPVVAGMILACGVPVSILSAEIRTIGQGQYGQLTIQLPDDLEACLRARQYLKEQGVQAEEVETE